jgi:hypothetical protein
LRDHEERQLICIGGIIADYYPHIDNMDTEWVLRLFADDAVYERADATYNGIFEIRGFFCSERQIRGKHNLSGLWTVPASNTVFVTGRFEGYGAEGDPRGVKFADIWQFNENSKVIKRETYLGLGHAYIQR